MRWSDLYGKLSGKISDFFRKGRKELSTIKGKRKVGKFPMSLELQPESFPTNLGNNFFKEKPILCPKMNKKRVLKQSKAKKYFNFDRKSALKFF